MPTKAVMTKKAGRMTKQTNKKTKAKTGNHKTAERRINAKLTEVTAITPIQKTTSFIDVRDAGLAAARDGLNYLAEAISADLSPGQMTTTFTEMLDLAKALEALTDNVKDRLKAIVLETGETTTEKGSRRALIDGWEVEVRPWRTGFDARKVEGMLRAKGLDVNKYMGAKLTYEVTAEGIVNMKVDDVVTADELETCKYDLKWTLQTPRKARENEANDE